MAHFSKSAATASPSFSPPLPAIASLAARLKAHVDTLMTIRALRDLDDRSLADLGVMRHEIADAVRNGRFH